MSETSPTKRTLDLCRKQNWDVQVVERWCSFSRRRIDLFGVVDLVAMDGIRIIGIQSTSGSNFNARIRKILAEPRAKRWLESGARLFVHGWRKLARTRSWDCREQEITVDMFPDSLEGNMHAIYQMGVHNEQG